MSVSFFVQCGHSMLIFNIMLISVVIDDDLTAGRWSREEVLLQREFFLEYQ